MARKTFGKLTTSKLRDRLEVRVRKLNQRSYNDADINDALADIAVLSMQHLVDRVGRTMAQEMVDYRS